MPAGAREVAEPTRSPQLNLSTKEESALTVTSRRNIAQPPDPLDPAQSFQTTAPAALVTVTYGELGPTEAVQAVGRARKTMRVEPNAQLDLELGALASRAAAAMQ